MNATATRPGTDYRLSRSELRRRWQELARDPLVAAIPFKVELNEKGAIEVSPPTTRHAFLQFVVARELARQRPDGTTFTGCPVETEIAREVWIIDDHGAEIHSNGGRAPASALGFEPPELPAR